MKYFIWSMCFIVSWGLVTLGNTHPEIDVKFDFWHVYIIVNIRLFAVAFQIITSIITLSFVNYEPTNTTTNILDDDAF